MHWIILGCCLAVWEGQADPGEYASPLDTPRQLIKAEKAWFPQPVLGIYIPLPARGNNKLFHVVTDPTGQTTRSLQAIYQIKRVLNSTMNFSL